MKITTFVTGTHLDQWFADNPGFHRTDQQGQRMICPKRQPLGYPIVALTHRASRTTLCPHCLAKLEKAFPLQVAERLPGSKQLPPRLYIGPAEKGELGWRTVA